MSKAYGLPGLRIGWLACDKEMLERFERYKHYLSICNLPFRAVYDQAEGSGSLPLKTKRFCSEMWWR